MENLRYNSGQGEKKNWLIEETVFDAKYLGKCESIFSQGNGYLCQRAALEERYTGETRNLFVTGTFNCFSPDEVTELPNLPDMTAIRLMLNGERFSMETGKLHKYNRSFDLQSGLLKRMVEWESPLGKKYLLNFERFVSLENEHLLGSRVEITPLDADANVLLESGIDGRVSNTGSQHFLEGEKRLYEGKYLETSSKTIQSGVVCCQHMTHTIFVDGKAAKETPLPIIDRRYLAERSELTVKKQQKLVVEKICCVHTSRDLAYHKDENAAQRAKEDGIALIHEVRAKGYDKIREESALAWEKLWKQMDIQIDSKNGYHQLAIRFALYHLNIMVKKDDNRVGIGAKGMSGEGYKGHSFWDTEMFILPYFALTQPKTARTLLEYRWRGLYGARLKAKDNNYTGAMYPWESAWINDGEVTPLWGAADVVTGERLKILTGILEHHITADIAFAVWQYYTITGDEDFMEKCGYEILIETARFWASRSERNDAKKHYEITDVIGPDEYKEHIDNNAYTNYMAAHNMRLALQAIEKLLEIKSTTTERLNVQLNFEEAEKEIREVLEKLYLPTPAEDKIIPQFDGYFDLKHIDLEPYKQSDVVGTIYNDYNMEQIGDIQVSKQADLLVLFFLLEDLFDAETKRKNFSYYEARTLHDSSLSKNTHSVLASDLDLPQEAEHLFEGSCDVDLGPNMKTSDMGIHSAAMGGIWQSVVYGFGGVRVVGNQLRISPKLHNEWSKLAFPLVWKGVPLKIEINKNAVVVSNRGKAETKIILCGKETKILQGEKAEHLF